MSDSSTNLNFDNLSDISYLAFDNSLNASYNTIDTNSNKISAAVTSAEYISSCSNSNKDIPLLKSNIDEFNCSISVASDLGAFPNYSPITEYKGIDLTDGNKLQFDNFNENMINISNALTIDAVCTDDSYSTSTTKCVDLFSNNPFQVEVGSEIISDLSNMSVASIHGSAYTDNCHITQYKSLELSSDSNFVALNPANDSTSYSKGIDISSNNSFQVQDRPRSMKRLNSKSFNDYSSEDIPVPKKPLITMQNCFDVSKTCGLKSNVLKKRIEDALIEKVEMSFEFDEKYFTWNAVYIKGSAHCKFQVHVYGDKESFLMEIHKLSGDSLTFHSIAKDIKNSVFGVKEESAELMFPVSSMQPCDVLSDADAFAAIEVFKEMAAEPFVESQLEASRILCDLSQQEGMHHILKDSGCIQILVNLATFGGTEWTRQHAVLALANLSTSRGCQNAIIDAGVLPALLTLATDGPYHSAAMRRESARLLANISDSLAQRVIAALGKQEVLKWFQSMDSFRDGTLRGYAQRAKGFLAPMITTA